jgi:hypothetical protein
VTQYSFVATATYPADVLHYLNDLCLTIQKQNLNVEMVISQVNACVAAPHDICDNNGGAYFKEFLKAVPDSVLEVEPGSGIGTFVHKNHEISISHAMEDAFVSDVSTMSTYMHALLLI